MSKSAWTNTHIRKYSNQFSNRQSNIENSSASLLLFKRCGHARPAVFGDVHSGDPLLIAAHFQAHAVAAGGDPAKQQRRAADKLAVDVDGGAGRTRFHPQRGWKHPHAFLVPPSPFAIPRCSFPIRGSSFPVRGSGRTWNSRILNCGTWNFGTRNREARIWRHGPRDALIGEDLSGRRRWLRWNRGGGWRPPRFATPDDYSRGVAAQQSDGQRGGNRQRDPRSVRARFDDGPERSRLACRCQGGRQRRGTQVEIGNAAGRSPRCEWFISTQPRLVIEVPGHRGSRRGVDRLSWLGPGDHVVQGSNQSERRLRRMLNQMLNPRGIIANEQLRRHHRQRSNVGLRRRPSRVRLRHNARGIDPGCCQRLDETKSRHASGRGAEDDIPNTKRAVRDSRCCCEVERGGRRGDDRNKVCQPGRANRRQIFIRRDAVKICVNEIRGVSLESTADRTRHRRMIERKLTECAQTLQQRAALVGRERLGEGPDDNLLVRFWVNSEKDRTEPALSESSADLK